jgi:hypothetical protein
LKLTVEWGIIYLLEGKNMKLIEFDYVDLKGKPSHRVLLVQQEPHALFAGLDLSELTSEFDMGEYAAKAAILKEQYLAQLAELNRVFDMQHRYRSFKPEQMTNITTETI